MTHSFAVDDAAPRITINFDPDFPSASLKGRAFELIATRGSTTELAYKGGIQDSLPKGGNFPTWTLGRHPAWCDFTVEPECRALSVIHMTIGYDRLKSCWMVLDGGFHPDPIKYKGVRRKPKHARLEREAGYGPSSYGIWLNNYRLPTKKFKPVQPGDRLLLDDEFKIIFTKDLYATLGAPMWGGEWKDDPTEDEQETRVADVQEIVMRQTQDKVEEKTPVTLVDLADKILNGPDGVEDKYWWFFLMIVGAFVFYVWAKYLEG